MNIKRLNLNNKKTCVILGAGASRGASCFEKTWIQPPLDADFFAQAQNLASNDTSGILKELLEFVKEEFDPTLSIPMEKLFTQIEALDSFHTAVKIDRGPRMKRYGNVLEKFTSAVATIFDLLAKECPGKKATCSYHEALVGCIETGDAILSFNYDCLIDEALKKNGRKSWNPETGYGFSVTGGADHWRPPSAKGRAAGAPIALLKLHGSLNWDRGTMDELHLRDKPYDAATRHGSEIVPPVWNKRIESDPLLIAVWKQARNALRDADVIVVIGYSIPDTDLLTQALLRVAPVEDDSGLTHLVVVNPDAAVRQKCLGVFRQALDSKTVVLQFKDLRAFSEVLA